MADGFNVLKCFQCNVFQVHMKKKSTKWQCKLCGVKQSLMKVYGNGSAFDCRQHAQKLNLLKGQQEKSKDCLLLESGDEDQEQMDINWHTSEAKFEKLQSTKKFRLDGQQSMCSGEETFVQAVEGPKTVFPSIHNTPMTSKWFKYLDPKKTDAANE